MDEKVPSRSDFIDFCMNDNVPRDAVAAKMNLLYESFLVLMDEKQTNEEKKNEDEVDGLAATVGVIDITETDIKKDTT
jgi:hypothetical protein